MATVSANTAGLPPAPMAIFTASGTSNTVAPTLDMTSVKKVASTATAAWITQMGISPTTARLVLDHQTLLLEDLESQRAGWTRLRLEVTHAIGEHVLPGLNYVLRERHSSMRATLDKALFDIGIDSVPVAMEVGSTDVIVEMLQRGRHVSFLPRFAVQDALASGTLYHIRVQGLRIKRTLWIARTRSNLDNPVAEAFIQLLRGG